jgi:hypothetical protein
MTKIESAPEQREIIEIESSEVISEFDEDGFPTCANIPVD